MSDERDPLDPIRELRPDAHRDDEPNDPWVLAKERDRLMSSIEQTAVEPRATWQPPAIYPRLGYEDERGRDRVPHAGIRLPRTGRGTHGTPDRRARVARAP